MTFWRAYPKKKHRGDAYKAWLSERPTLADVLAAIAWQRTTNDWTKEGGQFIPYPGTWLRAQGWADERLDLSAIKTPPPSPYCGPHSRGFRGRVSSEPTKACPECKHVRALGLTRESEMASVASLLPGYGNAG